MTIGMTREQSVQNAISHLELPDQVTIRAWRVSDYPDVRDLALAEGWTTLTDRPEEGLHAWQRSWQALVAIRENVVIGFLRALTDESVTLYVADLLVVPAWRGRGIGGSLLEMCHLLYPNVRFDLLSTQVADEFYQKQGFRPFRGFRRSYR